MSLRRYVSLIETEILLEDRLTFLRDRFLPLLNVAVQAGTIQWPENIAPRERASRLANTNVRSQIADKLFTYIISVDPDPQKKNSQWLLTSVLRKNQPMPFEDLAHASESLTKFAEMKRAGELAPDKTDINRFRSLSDLNVALRGEQEQRTTALATQDQAMLAQTDIIYDGPDFRVISLKTKEAAAYFSSDTEWCTAWGMPGCRHPTRTNQYESYIRKGPLYVIFDKSTHEKWQFSFATDQYMDVEDNQIDLRAFFKQRPKLAQVFEQMDGDPIGEIAGYPVYKVDESYVVKTVAGPLGGVLLKAEFATNLTPGREARPEDDVLHALTGSWITAYNNRPASRDEAFKNIRQFLTEFKIKGDPLGDDVVDLYYRDGKWGTLRELAQPLYRLGESDLLGPQIVWRQLKTHTAQRLILDGQNNTEYLEAEIFDGSFGVVSIENVYHAKSVADNPMRRSINAVAQVVQAKELLPIVSFAITELLLKESVERWSPDSRIKPDELTYEDGDRLTKAKPELASIPMAYKMHGAAPVVKEMIEQWYNRHDLISSPSKPPWAGDNLIIEQFKDVDELVESLGNDTAKWCVRVLRGDEFIEYESGNADKDDLIRSLPHEMALSLGKYLQQNYPDEAEDIDFQPRDISSVIELAEAVEDTELDNAVDAAASTGAQVGSEHEMFKALHDAIKSANNVVFLSKDEPTDDFAWDSPCAFVVPIKELVERMASDNEDDLAGEIYSGGWDDTFEASVNVDSPYNGFSDYDEKAAQERFAEEIYQFAKA